MKKSLVGLTIAIISLFTFSCDPDVAREGITLSPLEFSFTVHPDTSFIQIGDTVTFESTISSETMPGVKLQDGIAALKCYIGLWETVPVTSYEAYREIYDGVDYRIIFDNGQGKYNSSVHGLLLGLQTIPSNDSFSFKFKIVFLKSGTYQFSFYSDFYEGTKGKTRTSGSFNVPNTHWDELWDLPEYPPLTPGDKDYYSNYLIGVIE